MKRYFRILASAMALLMAMLSLGSCTAKDRRVVAECGGYEVLYEEIRFEALTYLYRNPDASEEEVRLEVERAVKERYAVLALCAEHLPELTLESEELEARAEADEEAIIESLGGKSEYRKSLKEIYANRHFFRYFLKITLMQGELENEIYKGTHLESDKTLLDWWKAGNCTRVTRVRFSDRGAAEALLAELGAGKTMESLVGSDALAGSTIDSHYYYFRDLHGSADETAALALAATGDVSGVVETSEGFCVMIREADDFETLVYQTSAALNLYREAQVATLIAEKAATMTFEWNNRGAKLVFGEMK
jgi:hypothetical protein